MSIRLQLYTRLGCRRDSQMVFVAVTPLEGTHAKIIIVARKPKEIKITYKYVGDESPEAKAEAQKRVDEVFDMIFDEAFRNLKKKKANTIKSSNKK